MANDLKYDNVSMRFGPPGPASIVAIEDFSFHIRTGEFLVIVGPSGCGKSTLLSMTAALRMPSAGRILLGGQEIRVPGPDRAMVFQNFSLFPWKTVWQNIEFGLRLAGVEKKARACEIERIVSLIGLNGFEHHFPRQLSGGMQQRVALARSFVLKPRVLLMDEPFAALDAQNRTIMQEELVRIWTDQEPTVLFITHSVEEAVFLADRIIVMSKRPGRIKEVIDVNAAVGTEHWRTQTLDEVMGKPLFQELRHRVWKMIKAELS